MAHNLHSEANRCRSLPSDEGVFMADSPDSHFIVQVPHQTEQKFEQSESKTN
jgi:hypothetical protein